jgi:hypothetical protein
MLLHLSQDKKILVKIYLKTFRLKASDNIPRFKAGKFSHSRQLLALGCGLKITEVALIIGLLFSKVPAMH